MIVAKMGFFSRILYLIFVSGMILFSGCRNLYRRQYVINGEYIEKKPLENFDFSNTVTCSMKGATIEDVVELLPSGVGVVYDEELMSKPIFGELQRSTYADFFAVVAKNIDCDLEKLGNVYVFSSKKEKKDVDSSGMVTGSYRYFFRLSGIPKLKVNEIFSPYKVKYIGSSKYVFIGSVSDAVNCHTVYENVIDSLPSEYVFDVYFISDDLLKEIYFLDGKTNGVFNASWGIGSALAKSSFDWSYVFTSAYNLGISYSNSRGFRVLSGVFNEDNPYTVTIGDSIPIVNKSVLESGAVVDSGVTYQDIGIRLTISCEGLSRGVVNIDLSVTDSSGSVAGYPIKHGSTIKSCFSVSDDDFHFVGSFFGDVKQNKSLGFSRSVSCFYVVARVRRLSENQSVLMDPEKKEEKK